MSKNIDARVKQKYDTSANWTSANPVLLAGEIGIESNTGKFKFGDGSTAWNSIDYAGGTSGTGSSVTIYYVDETAGYTLSQVNVFETLDDFSGYTGEIGQDEMSIFGEVDVVVEHYQNGANWYRKYASGWVKQCMEVAINSSGQAITWLVAMANTNWTPTACAISGGARYVAIVTYSATGATLYSGDDSSFNSCTARITVEGYAA